MPVIPCLVLACYFVLFVSADVIPFTRSDRYQDGTFGNYPAQAFISDREAVAPVSNVVLEAQKGVSPNRFITWAPAGSAIPLTGPQILDTDNLSLIYQAPVFGSDNFGLSVQTCNDTSYLIWWSGSNIDGRAAGTFHILDNSYNNAYNITAVGLAYADAHDLILTPQCTAVFTVNEPREYDLAHFGIDHGWIMESYFQEVDLASNELLFQWRASDHVSVGDTYWTPDIRDDAGRQGLSEEESLDYFHINSVEKDGKGNYLISARHMASIYYIDGKTGFIFWTLGGRENDFTDLSDGRATDFAWQHHARWTSSDLTSISFFDDRNCRYVKSADPLSRGVVLDLEYMTRTVSLAKEYRATSGIQSFRKGGMHHLENGNALLGYGNEPGFTEFAPNGTVLWDVRFGPIGLDRNTADNYRSLKLNWTGDPSWNPKIAAGPPLEQLDLMIGATSTTLTPSNVCTNDTAYFSWNGATRLSNWLILASNDSPNVTSLNQLWCTVPKAGFESNVRVGQIARYIRAVALSGEGDVLAASPVLDMQDGSTSERDWDAVDFSAEYKESLDDEESDVREWIVELNAIKKDWRTMKTTTRQAVIAVVCFGLLAVFGVVAGFFWHFREACAAKLLEKRSGDGYSSIDEVEVGSAENAPGRAKLMEQSVDRSALFALLHDANRMV